MARILTFLLALVACGRYVEREIVSSDAPVNPNPTVLPTPLSTKSGIPLDTGSCESDVKVALSPGSGKEKNGTHELVASFPEGCKGTFTLKLSLKTPAAFQLLIAADCIFKETSLYDTECKAARFEIANPSEIRIPVKVAFISNDEVLKGHAQLVAQNL